MRWNKNRSIFVLIAVMMVIQIIICDYIYTGPYIHLTLLPLIILSISAEHSYPRLALISFAVGFLIDLVSDGILGLNSAAAVMTATFVRPISYITINRERSDKLERPTLSDVGFFRYFRYSTYLTLIFLITYILLDCAGFRPASFILMRIALSYVANIIMILFVSVTLLNKRY
jgi:ABC-type Fe3+-siderophore transport system permease subunit